MRILHVALYGSVKGGTESYVRTLCEGQRSQGHEVALAYRYDADESRPEVTGGFLLESIASDSEEPLSAERAEVERAVERFRPELVHVHNVEASWMPAVFGRTAPTILAVHDHRLDCPTGTRYWTAWKRACGIHPGAVCLGYNVTAHCGSLRANATLRPYARWRRHRAAALRAPRIQVFSDYMAGMLARSGLDHERVTVTPYPVPPMPAASPIPTTTGAPVVFSTGRLVKEKGFDVLIDALASVRTPVHLAIAGEGHHGDALRESARGVPARHTVTFLGWLPPNQLAGWYEAATIVAVPSAWPEPFGIVGLEAMAAGKAVIAGDVGGVRQWLVHGSTGLAVPSNDPAAFARAMESLLSDEGLRAHMGAAARERIATEFSLATHLERIARLYDEARASWRQAA